MQEATGIRLQARLQLPGVAEQVPLHVDWNRCGPVTIGLTDTLPGYHRFAWDPAGINC